MMRRAAVADAARALTGARFRLQGRDPARGIDCVGLVVAALAGAGIRAEPPADYPLRGGDPAQVAAAMARIGLAAIDPHAAGAGDIVLAAPGPGQLHLAVLTGDGFVHADAGLRRVVERPGRPDWTVLAAWRVEEDRWRP